MIDADRMSSRLTVSDACLKRTCSLDTSTCSAIEFLDDNRVLYKFTYLLTYPLSYGKDNDRLLWRRISSTQVPAWVWSGVYTA